VFRSKKVVERYVAKEIGTMFQRKGNSKSGRQMPVSAKVVGADTDMCFLESDRLNRSRRSGKMMKYVMNLVQADKRRYFDSFLGIVLA